MISKQRDAVQLYADSCSRQDARDNDSDKKITVELPQPIQVTTRAYVDVMLVPVTFYVI